MTKKKLEDLNLMDDFLFQAIMSYPDIGELFARKILELIFRRQFQNLQVVAQKVYGGLNTDLRGARLDLYVEENDCAKINASCADSVYDLEPDQNNKTASIHSFPKRVRFYHAIIDRHILKSGQEFGKLKNVYVIFLCNYDPFGCDRAKYTIKNMCVEDPDMPYEDGACTIVLYTKGTQGDIPEDLRQFLDYMEHTNAAHAVSDTLKELQQMVDTVKQDGEVSISYMKWFEHDQMLLEEGRAEERKNTEKERENAKLERLRAEAAENRANSAESRANSAESRANSAESRANFAESLNHSLSEKLRLYEKTYGKLSTP